MTSEVGRLRSVMIHRPGIEIDRMVPAVMEELLFDDILFGDRAREEHRRFQKLIELVADEVLEFEELLAEILADDGVRGDVLSSLEARLPLPEETWRILRADSGEELAAHLIEGIPRPGVSEVPENTAELFLLPPVPNLFFQRDPAVVIGEHVVLGSMATEARFREPLLADALFRHHPRFARGGASPVLFPSREELGRARGHRRFSLEGGDVLVPRADLLLVGVSIRTERATIEALAAALKRGDSSIEKVVLVEIPKARSFMHLDTVFTFVSQHECLIYEPAILPGGVEEVDVYQVDLGAREVSYTAKTSLLQALEDAGFDLEPIPCGGPDDPIAQQREQWTDGANAFALAPGVILCYERNVKTAEELDRAGYTIVHENELLLGRVELDLDGGHKYALMVSGHELSRARGGPRCMTMPLARDPVP